MTYNLQKEVNEAVRAGEQSLSSLRRVLKSLDSARNWGVFDMFGGGGLTASPCRTRSAMPRRTSPESRME